MNVETTPLPGVLVVQPKVFGDARGFFVETYNEARYQSSGVSVRFVQDNHSLSTQRGVLRGLHFQRTKPQDKLVWCIEGQIWDVAVDVRPSSPTFKQWFGVHLDTENKKQIFVPAGFAHGFVVLSERAQVVYKCSALYDPSDEGGLIWNDPTVNIDWPLRDVILSAKDQALPTLENARLV